MNFLCSHYLISKFRGKLNIRGLLFLTWMIKSINLEDEMSVHKKGLHDLKKIWRQGVNAIDFDIMNDVLKFKWLKSFIQNSHSFWFIVFSAIFKNKHIYVVTLNEPHYQWNFPSAFHQQVLLYWKLLFKHNFMPHNTPVWNNI